MSHPPGLRRHDHPVDLHSPECLSPQRRRAWEAAVAPDEPHKLAHRLAWDGLDTAALERQWQAQESVTTLDLSSWPPGGTDAAQTAWIPALQACKEALQANWRLPLLPYDAKGRRPFVDLWWPIRCLGVQRLRQVVADLPGDWIATDAVCEQLADSLLDRLCALGEQLLWQRFNSTRKAGTVLLAHLGAQGDGTGPPIREHYQSFIREHRRDGLTALLREFPVFAPLLGKVVMLWEESSAELLRRVWTDLPALAAGFSIPANAMLSSVSMGLSDPHRGARVVAILEFRGPDERRIVYKPKDMAVDAAYQAVLADLNAHAGLPPLRTLSVLVREGYGYMEWISHRPCKSPAELRRFYTNAGRLLALLHLLGCTDCHHENLIASGDQLLLIDTETLLEPQTPDHCREATSNLPPPPLSRLHRRLQSSVLRSGLLPQWLIPGAGGPAVDISALGVQPPLTTTQKRMGWLGLNSDGMLPGPVSTPADLPTSLPVGIGAANPFIRHLAPFCQGFEVQCHALQSQQGRWLAADGILNGFRGLKRRMVLRPTRVYAAIQRQMLAPAALRTPFAQAMVLEQLARSFLLAETKPRHWPILAAEVRQMAQLDIPVFTHPIDEDVLLLGVEPSLDPTTEEQELPGFFRASGLDAALDRWHTLSREEVAFQLRLIHGAAVARVLNATPGVPSSSSRNNVEAPEPIAFSPPINGLEAACRLMGLLFQLAITDPAGEIEWLGVDLGDDGESFGYGPVGPTLYGGAMGIACLLQRLSCLGVDLEPFASNSGLAIDSSGVIEAVLKPVRELVAAPQGDDRLRWWRDQSLGLSGCGGVLLGLSRLDEVDLVDDLLAAAPPRVLQQDRQLDVVGGCAGLIGPLLLHNSTHARALARVAGDRLLEQQNKQGAWIHSTREQALLGFSHGTAGYAAALARLHHACGDDRYFRGAAAALAYERRRFDPSRNNWPDYRQATTSSKPTDRADFIVSWCHGAPGIALGRACLWGTALWDDHCVMEIEAALRTTAAAGDIGSDHLCCGTLGLLSVLELLGMGPWPLAPSVRDLCREAAHRQRQQALMRCTGATRQQTRLRCFPIQEGSLTLPGFFTGLSGIGLALLEDGDSRRLLALLLTAGLWPMTE